MAELSYFFNSINGDRKYNTDHWAEYFKPLFTTGVFNGDLQVTANDDMTISIEPGNAWLEGRVYHNTERLTLNIDTASGTLNRWDDVIIKLDLTGRTIGAYVRKGAEGTSQGALTVERTETVTAIMLGTVFVEAGTIAITQSMIADTRLNNAVCGLVTQAVESIDTSTLMAQLNAWAEEYKTESQATFDAFMTTLTNILDENAAGNLLNEINVAKEEATNQVNAAKAEATDQVNNAKYLQKTIPIEGTATELTKTIPGISNYSELDGIKLTIKAKYSASKDQSKTIDFNGLGAKMIDPVTFVANKYYDIIYNSADDRFFTKASAYGPTPDKVLAGEPFMNEDGEQVGALQLPNPSDLRLGVNFYGVIGTCIPAPEWTQVSATNYVNEPSWQSRVEIADTTAQRNSPIKWVGGGTPYYGIIAYRTGNTCYIWWRNGVKPGSTDAVYVCTPENYPPDFPAVDTGNDYKVTVVVDNNTYWYSQVPYRYFGGQGFKPAGKFKVTHSVGGSHLGGVAVKRKDSGADIYSGIIIDGQATYIQRYSNVNWDDHYVNSFSVTVELQI